MFNVKTLGEEADLEAQNFQFSKNANRKHECSI